MRPANDIHKLIKKLHLKASAELDRRVHDDISKSLAESEKTESARSKPNIWRSITRGGVAKLAVAAAILITFGIGFSVGRWSKPARPAQYSLDVTDYTSVISVYPTVPKAEDSFWRRKVLAAMKPKPYSQIQITKTNLIDAYKQYLREKHYD